MENSPRRDSDSSALTDVSFSDDSVASSASPEVKLQDAADPTSLELEVVVEDEDLLDDKKKEAANELTILECFQAEETDEHELLMRIYAMDDAKALEQILEKDENGMCAIHHAAQTTSITDTLFREMLRIVEATEESRKIFEQVTPAGDTILHLLAEESNKPEHVLLVIARNPKAVLMTNKLGHRPIHSAHLLEQDGTKPSEIRDENPLICAILEHAEKCLQATAEGDPRGKEALDEMCPMCDSIELCRRRDWQGIDAVLSDVNLSESANKQRANDLFKFDSTTFNCLHHAVWGHAPFAIIEKIVELGKAGGEEIVRSCTSGGRTALHLACMASDDVLLVKHLIRLYPDPLLDESDRGAGRPFDLAKKCYTNRYNHKRIVEIVHRATLALQQEDYDALRQLCPVPGLCELCLRCDWASALAFVTVNAEKDPRYLRSEIIRKDDTGWNCLHYLLRYRGPSELLCKIIKSVHSSQGWTQEDDDPAVFNPPILSITTPSGFAPLHIAALYAMHCSILKILILEYPMALALKTKTNSLELMKAEIVEIMKDTNKVSRPPPDCFQTPLQIFEESLKPRIHADEIQSLLRSATSAYLDGSLQELHNLCAPPPRPEPKVKGKRLPATLTMKDYQTQLAAVTLQLDSLKTRHDEVTRCCVCWTEERSVVFLSCGHRCCCAKCGDKVNKCPLCRVKIKKKIKSIG
ncbi:hypothetical protein TrST_g4707 [Triparma strigata]|uniref:RING-type domain-containing protein n=1 Tax=Triparma strigata TaxID=1606541 RepID=A0A9W7AFT3_9STRA|nr:hypothetical protein TrST_g4707 [Triparma strigata]